MFFEDNGGNRFGRVKKGLSKYYVKVSLSDLFSQQIDFETLIISTLHRKLLCGRCAVMCRAVNEISRKFYNYGFFLVESAF